MTAALVILAALIGINAWLKHADNKRCEWAQVTHEPLEDE